MTKEAISAIRTRAELARRLAKENKQADARTALLEIASVLDADADRLDATAQQEPRPRDRA